MISLTRSVATFSWATEVWAHTIADNNLRIAKVVTSIIGAKGSYLLFLILVLLPTLLWRWSRWVSRGCSQVVDCDARQQLIGVIIDVHMVAGVRVLFQHRYKGQCFAWREKVLSDRDVTWLLPAFLHRCWNQLTARWSRLSKLLLLNIRWRCH